MPDSDDTTNETTTATDGSNANTSTTDQTTGVTNGTATQATSQNDPIKNKRLAYLTMSEQLRSLFSFELTLPGTYKGMHTNQFLWMDVTDDFYDDFYSDIMENIGLSKFNRYTGFKKGRFYIEKKEWKYDSKDGVKTTLTINPIPSMYSDYMKAQLEAERALDQAVIDATPKNKGSVGSSVNATGTDCNASDGTESNTWAGHKCNPPKCTSASKTIHGNSSRQYAKDTASHNSSSRDLVNYVASLCEYQLYADNPHGESRCPENMWTGGKPIRGNCADFARMLKCILDVNGYNSIICHIPGHFYNAIWENNQWTVCDICAKTCWGREAYGHANHGNIKPLGTWDSPVS